MCAHNVHVWSCCTRALNCSKSIAWLALPHVSRGHGAFNIILFFFYLKEQRVVLHVPTDRLFVCAFSERVACSVHIPVKWKSATRDCASRETCRQSHEQHFMYWFRRHSHWAHENWFVPWIKIYDSNQHVQHSSHNARFNWIFFCEERRTHRHIIEGLITGMKDFKIKIMILCDINCDEWHNRGAT